MPVTNAIEKKKTKKKTEHSEKWALLSAIKSEVLFIGPGGGKSGTSWWSKCLSVVEIDWKCAQHHDCNFGFNKPTYMSTFTEWTATVMELNGIASRFNQQLSAMRPPIVAAFQCLHMAGGQNFIVWFAESDIRRKKKTSLDPSWEWQSNAW